MSNNEHYNKINNFYKKTASNFLEWSPDPKRRGLYVMHIGYQNWQNPVSNSISALGMSHKIIELSELQPKQVVLDAGCGVGSLAFEIMNIESESRVHGIDVSKNHADLASRNKGREELSYPIFSIQDYENLAFQNKTFDRIIYCESLIHSRDKESLIKEANRILRLGGKITIADIFMHTDNLTEEETSILDGIKKQMYIPNIIHIQGLITLLSKNNFSNINARNITEHVVLPKEYYPDRENKTIEENMPQDVETLLAGLQSLLRNGKAGYYLLTAQKNV